MLEPAADLADVLAGAWADHQAGRLQAAEQGYRRVLALEPEHVDALHLLGVLANQLGHHREALTLIARAIRGRPTEAAFFCNLGEAHRALGETDQALACQRQALALEPKLAEAHNNLGLALQQQGHLDQAKASYRAALALEPRLADALINLGNLLAAEGRVVEAVDHFERALELQPRAPKAHYNLANALREQGLLEPAIASYRRALELAPDDVDALNNLGLALLESERIEAAIERFEAVLARRPEHAEALNNLGLAHEAEGDLDQARGAYERALAADPGSARAHNNLGRLQHRTGELEAAIGSFRRALELDPDYVAAHNNLGHLLKDTGRLEQSIDAFLQAVGGDDDHADSTAQLVYQLQAGCQWARLAELGPKVDAQTRAALAEGKRPGETPFGDLARSSDPAWHLAVARAWARGIERKMAASGRRFAFDDRRAPRHRIRLGYLSCDFRDHPVAHQITKLLQIHDRTRFEVRAYAYGRHGPSPERARIAASCDAFVDLEPLSDVAAAERIFADEVDILIDLTGYTKGNRLQIAVARPAPVQVSYLGFLGTTGGGFMDYLITDAVCTPFEEARFFTEQLVHLPECCLVFGEEARPVNQFKRLDFGLPDAGFVFCSLNANYKIEPVLFDVWMELLRAVPGSVLWLYRGSDAAALNLQREAKARGIEGRRLVFADRIPYADNLRRLQLADLALDTRVYNGGLTTANALWAGMPAITLAGSDFVSRMATSMLTTLGLSELVTHSLEEYQALALALAREPERLGALGGRLEARLHAGRLFDTARFARHLEAAYDTMWERFQTGAPPQAIVVGAGAA